MYIPTTTYKYLILSFGRLEVNADFYNNDLYHLVLLKLVPRLYYCVA